MSGSGISGVSRPAGATRSPRNGSRPRYLPPLKVTARLALKVSSVAHQALCRALFRRDAIALLGQRLDAILDRAQRIKAGLHRFPGEILHHVGRDRIAKAVEIVDELLAARGQEQAVGAAVLWIVAPLEQALLDQTIEQPHQRDRLQLEHLGKIDLREAFFLAQPKQHDPLRARRAAALGAIVDEVAQEPRALHELRDKLAFQVQRHSSGGPLNLADSLGFSSYSVFTH